MPLTIQPKLNSYTFVLVPQMQERERVCVCVCVCVYVCVFVRERARKRQRAVGKGERGSGIMRADTYAHKLSNQIQSGYHLFCVSTYSKKLRYVRN